MMTAISSLNLCVQVNPVRRDSSLYYVNKLYETFPRFLQNYNCIYVQSMLIVKTIQSRVLNVNVMKWNIRKL
jgi:hypothetical protein